MRTTEKSTRSSALVEPRLGRSVGFSLAGKGEALSVSSILVPVDFSAPSKSAYKLALKIARQFGARVHVLHVLQKISFPDFNAFPLARSTTDTVAAARRSLIQFAQTDDQTVVPVYPDVRCGNPWSQIVDAAAEDHVDLIVIPTHGYTGVRRAFIGSIAERVVRHAPCPVLVLRPKSPAPKGRPAGKEKMYED